AGSGADGVRASHGSSPGGSHSAGSGADGVRGRQGSFPGGSQPGGTAAPTGAQGSPPPGGSHPGGTAAPGTGVHGGSSRSPSQSIGAATAGGQSSGGQVIGLPVASTQ